MGEKVFISIGSNLGNRAENCAKAIGLLSAKGTVAVIRRSSLYETRPWGKTGQGSFVNCVVEVDTGLPPGKLLGLLKGVESEMGRAPGERWGPRTIDLDIIFYGSRVLSEKDLEIPHPLMHERAFVLAPLAELAPGFVHPALKKTVSEILASLGDKEGVKRLAG